MPQLTMPDVCAWHWMVCRSRSLRSHVIVESKNVPIALHGNYILPLCRHGVEEVIVEMPLP